MKRETGKISEYGKMLTEREQEQKNAISNLKKEREQIKAKIEQLQAQKDNPESLEDYKAVNREIEESKAYIDYLERKAAQAKAGGAITADEYNAIKAAAYSEIKAIQADAAPEIQKHLFEAVALMEKYTAEIAPLDSMVNKAGHLHAPNGYIGQSISRSQSKERFSDQA